MKKNLFWMAAAVAVMALPGCSKDKENTPPPAPPVEYKQVKMFSTEKSAEEGMTPKDETIYTYDASKRISRVDQTIVTPYSSTGYLTNVVYAAGKVSTSGKDGIGGGGERDQRPTSYTLNEAGQAVQVIYGINEDYTREDKVDVSYNSEGQIAKIVMHLFETSYDPDDTEYEHPIYTPYDDTYTFEYLAGNLNKMTNETKGYKAVYTLDYGTKVIENKASIDFFAFARALDCDTFNDLCLYGINGVRSARIPVKISQVEYEDNEPQPAYDINLVITTDAQGYITQYTRDDETDSKDLLVKFKFKY